MIHGYKLFGYNIILDTESGSIHSVDEAAYDAIFMYERGTADDVKTLIRERYASIPENEIDELLSDIAELKRRGKLYSPEISAAAWGAPRRGAFMRAKTLKALCMNVSHLCNMTCSYCFAGSGKYGGGGELMTLDTGKRSIDYLIENSGGRKNLDVDFFGGEPLLNMSVVKEIVRYAKRRGRSAGKNFRFTITTNGLLIDDDVIDFINRETHNVVLSLDGRPRVNDAARTTPQGGGTYDDVVPKFRKLVDARGGKNYYIRGTYTSENPDFVNDITHIADLGFTELSVEPVVAAPGAPGALSMEDLPALREQYEMLAGEILRRSEEGRGFTFYHYKLDLTGGPCVYKRLAGCGSGTEYLAVTPDGSLYPCHQFVGNEDFLMGDVWRGVVREDLRELFGGCDINTRAPCRSCWARWYCSGGCAANAYNATRSIEGVYDLGCELFKKRVECAIMLKVAEKRRV